MNENKYEIRENPDTALMTICDSNTGKFIPDDEPVFILRAKDLHSVSALMAYQNICNNPAHRRGIAKAISDFVYWQAENPTLVKEPDTGDGE